jgi:hypothetical protein
VIPPNDNCQNRRLPLIKVVSVAPMSIFTIVCLFSDAPRRSSLVKPAELSVLLRNSHALQVSMVPDSLKISTYEKQVDFVVVLPLESLNVFVDLVKFTVATALNRYL